MEAVDKFLHLNDVLRMHEAMAHPEKKAFMAMIKAVETEIRNCVLYNRRDLVWTLPDFNPDLPVFDKYEMLTNLSKHFSQQGFYVYLHDRANFLYISWRYVK